MGATKLKNPVGRPPLDDGGATKNEGFTCTSDLSHHIRFLVGDLRKKGYKVDKSKLIRLLIEESIENAEKICRKRIPKEKKSA